MFKFLVSQLKPLLQLSAHLQFPRSYLDSHLSLISNNSLHNLLFCCYHKITESNIRKIYLACASKRLAVHNDRNSAVAGVGS